VCPGMHVAENSIFINIARTLWGFNIGHAKDVDGNVVPVDFTTKAFVPGALATPKPFKCCNADYVSLANCKAITPRSAKHAKILREEWAHAQRVGVDFSTVRFDKF
jgi:hypothetical protein